MEDLPLYAQYKVMLQMLADRGYNVPELKTRAEYASKHCVNDSVDRMSLTMQVQHREDRDNTMRVIFYSNGTNKIGKKEALQVLGRIGNNRRLIVVAPAFCVPTSQAKEVLHTHSRGDPSTGGIRIQWFTDEELAINVARDTSRTAKRRRLRYDGPPNKAYVPPPRNVRKDTKRHVPLMDAEKDPIARYYGVAHGQCLSSNAASETAGRYTSHRVAMYTEELPRETPVQNKRGKE